MDKSHIAVVKDKNWRPFLRQLFVCSGVWASFYMVGLCVGSTTVIVPQMRREANSTGAVSEDMVSWLSSVTFYSAIPWVLILTLLSQMFGRKWTMLLIMASSLMGYCLFIFGTNVIHLLISQALLGISSAAQLSTSLLVLTEFISPCYRGLFLTIKSASMFWGIWTSNVIGTFCSWKYIGILGILGSVYGLLTVLFWPESPYWLAKKKRIEECSTSHRWLKGSNKSSEAELKTLLNMPSELPYQGFKSFTNTFFYSKLYKPILLITLLLALYQFSGKMVCSIYALDIMKKITSGESAAYTGMIILDGVTVLGMYAGCILSKFSKRRSQILIATSIGIISLFALSLYLYLVKLTYLSENKCISLVLLIIFSLSICCGPMIMSTSIAGELLPLECRSFCVCVTVVIANGFMATSLKFGPLLFSTFDLFGAFLFYGICSSFLLLLIYIYLPETKDKTLQEIQNIVRGDHCKEIISPEKHITHL